MFPGIEICTVEKTWGRRTSCLQSNVDFLQKTITQLPIDHQQKIDAANRQIEALKATTVTFTEDRERSRRRAGQDRRRSEERSRTRRRRMRRTSRVD